MSHTHIYTISLSDTRTLWSMHLFCLSISSVSRVFGHISIGNLSHLSRHVTSTYLSLPSLSVHRFSLHSVPFSSSLVRTRYLLSYSPVLLSHPSVSLLSTFSLYPTSPLFLSAWLLHLFVAPSPFLFIRSIHHRAPPLLNSKKRRTCTLPAWNQLNVLHLRSLQTAKHMEHRFGWS